MTIGSHYKLPFLKVNCSLSNPPHHAYALATVGREVQMGRNPQAGLKKLRIHRHRKTICIQRREKRKTCAEFKQNVQQVVLVTMKM